MKTKYIIFKSWDDFEEIIVFGSMLNHRDMARGLRGEPISAGFIQIRDDKAFCFGNSESLSINSRPEDTLIANKMLGLD